MGRTIKDQKEPNALLYSQIEKEISKVAFKENVSNRREVWIISSFSGAMWKVDLAKVVKIFRKRHINVVFEPCVKFNQDYLKIIYTHKTQSFERFNKGKFY